MESFQVASSLLKYRIGSNNVLQRSPDSLAVFGEGRGRVEDEREREERGRKGEGIGAGRERDGEGRGG